MIFRKYWLQQLETAQWTQGSTEQQKLENKNGKEKILFGHFKHQRSKIRTRKLGHD